MREEGRVVQLFGGAQSATNLEPLGGGREIGRERESTSERGGVGGREIGRESESESERESEREREREQRCYST